MRVAQCLLAMVFATGLIAPAFAQDGVPSTTVTAPTVQSQLDPEAVRCVRIAETGSRVRASRVCKTNKEWSRIADAGNKKASDMVEAGRIVSIQGN